MPYLVMGYRLGTGAGGWTTVFSEPTNDVSDMTVQAGYSSTGTLSVITDVNGTWIQQQFGVGTASANKPSVWTFNRSNNYRITFKTANLNSGTNYYNTVEVGPFILRGYRNADDHVRFLHVNDTWDNTYPNAITGNTRDVYAEWEILYTPIDASTANMTVNKNGSLFGTKVIAHTTAVADGSSWQTLNMKVNNDSHRVSSLLVETQ